ncbi:MAG: hypothetical protein B7Y11_08125 [Sphingobacteriia bacterium 24-36-13]|jgi:hypothetical protein|uniref:hypothetical protein n=1 Tax=Sediminibacterium sp. TaxID=1917865 RepID=UPI000BCB97A2|nr:hypothetical protein [Sediminibacterium sp.]OYY11725.1 MAG: hypothetical protein B7Y66_01705 [Sphingobacteriia bacterium 35-36-14]OYZ53868.1 MAG: hypothetical protein B7Y11_08125 [Sphingobacteriia bacterium 24-36-13]HQS23632.1 hypothetical protein [Sediminibacterium sp.]
MSVPILDITTIEQLSKNQLIDAINWLIIHDFEKLVFILYRIDVSEAKIKTLLNKENTNFAAPVIADAIIERLEEKKVSRQKYKQDPSVSEEEKW